MVLKYSFIRNNYKKLNDNSFLKRSINTIIDVQFLKKNSNNVKGNIHLFLNRFVMNFLEFFFKRCVIFNIKKGSNKLPLKQISLRKFYIKYFKKNLKVSKQVIGILYYSFLLKDSTIFTNFFKRVVEKLNLKLHKKLLLGFKKLIKDLYKPIFNYLSLSGVFFNIRGKIGVSGSAKKRRYFFFMGKHSITNRTLKLDIKQTSLWTFTGTLGFTFILFF